VEQATFERECDRLSQAVDKIQYEQLRWARNEGPMLTHLAALANSALEVRSEFQLAEEGATSNVKRFALKVHSNRIIAITIYLEERRVSLKADRIERSEYRLSDESPISADYDAVDEQWMASALQELFSRIQS